MREGFDVELATRKEWRMLNRCYFYEEEDTIDQTLLPCFKSSHAETYCLWFFIFILVFLFFIFLLRGRS